MPMSPHYTGEFDEPSVLGGALIGRFRTPGEGTLRRLFMCTNCSVPLLMPAVTITAGGWEFHCPVCMEKQEFVPILPEGQLFRIGI